MSKVRTLLIDIETSPITGYTWQTYDASVLKILEPSKILSVAWKWLDEKETFCKTISDYKGYKKNIIDDEKLIKMAWALLDEADIVVAHYGKKFDLPKLAARFIYHGLSAPSSYQVVDTKQVASSKFKFDSNSLNNLGTYLNLGNKLQHSGFDLWVRCMAGDKDAWQMMKDYNVQDVVLLEKVYLALRPYITNHPNVSLITGTVDSCPTCESKNLQKRGFSYTRTGQKQRFQCGSCHSWSTGPFTRLKSSTLPTEDSYEED